MKAKIKTLEKEVKELRGLVLQQQVEIKKKNKALQNKDNIITALEHRLNKKLIEQFGRKSEKISPDQLGLFDEPLSSEEEKTDAEPQEITDIPKPNQKKQCSLKVS